MSYADLMVQRAVRALGDPATIEHDWSDLPTYDFHDPVALITEQDEGSTQPGALPFAQSQPFIDKMTSSPKEKRIAEKTYAQQTPGSSAAFQAAQAATGLEMLTTEKFVRKALAKKGLDYVWGGESKAEGGWDCSGLIVDILRKNGFSNFPRMVSGGLIEYAKPMSLKKAINTRGALLWAEGHIAISLGNGKTIEAANTEADIIVGSAHGRFTRGGMLPELTVANYPKRKPSRRPSSKSVPKRAPADSLNRLESVSSLVAAPMVFGSIMAEVNQRPASKREWDEFRKEPALSSFPARYRKMIRDAAERYGLPARLIGTIAKHESGYAADVVNFQRASSAGAVGPMQVMPLHTATYGEKFTKNVRANFMVGTAIFASYLEKAKGNLRLALAMYNAGPNASQEVLEDRMRIYADPILDDFYGKRAA